MWANERPCNSNKDIIEEAKESNAKGAGITGGDPLLYFEKTLSAAKALKKEFGTQFHIHIYLPFPLVTKEKLVALEKTIDEVRFHASFLTETTNKQQASAKQQATNKQIQNKNLEELEKLKLASQIFGKNRTGIELPMIPTKSKEILLYITKASPFISFCNLNEFELSDTNFSIIEKNYTLNSDTYTISNSIEEGKKILNHFKYESLSIHLCTAKTKNHHQYHNRLLRHNILPYGTRTNDATVIYYTIKPENLEQATKEIKKLTKHFYVDKSQNRIILKKSIVPKIYKTKKFQINFSEEHPTFDAEIMTFWTLSDEDFK